MNIKQEDSFSKITAVIDEEHENLVHDVCHVPRVMDLSTFYKIFETQEKAIDEKYDSFPNNAPNVELYAEAFKNFDTYPANLQKPKRAPPLRDRLNSTISRSSPSLNDSIGFAASTGHNKENSVSLFNLNEIDDVPPTASETLANFVKFQKHLKDLNAELLLQDEDKEYASKLKQINIFAQQLEKLLPSEKVGKSALTKEEENILEDMVNKMDDLNFIRNHQDVIRQQNCLTNNMAPKLENLVDILSYCLLAVNSFNIK